MKQQVMRSTGIFILASALFFALAQFNPMFALNGIDRSFGSNGKVVINASAASTGLSTAFGVAVHPLTGKVYAAGMGTLSNPDLYGMAVTRLNADGTPDASFGSTGKQLIFYQGSGTDVTSRANGLIVLADGSVIVAGSVTSFGAVMKLNNAGLLDTSFGTGGSSIMTFQASFNAITALGDGSFLVAGASGGNFIVAKFTSNGALDTTFGTGGFTKTAFVNSDVAACIAVQTDGKIVVGGRTSSDSALARYNSNGSLDTSFGTGGKVLLNIVTGNPDQINEVQIQPDNKIIAMGHGVPLTVGGERHILLRFNTNGTLDSTFGNGGIAGTHFGNSQEFLYGGKLLPNGKIIVTGFVGRNGVVARYNADGSPDRTFMCNGFGWVYFDTATTFGNLYDIAIQADGKMLVAGQSTSSPSIVRLNFAIARFNANDAPQQCPAYDFDHDGLSDISVVRPNAGGSSIWFRQLSSGSRNAFEYAEAISFGLSTDKYVPADFDGDGIPDTAIYRDGTWWIFRSASRQISTVNFGLPSDIPMPEDFDGDGIADVCVFRPSEGNWYRQNSSDEQIVAGHWGQSGDIPVIGDFDGDSKADLAVFRPSSGSWYVLQSSNGAARGDAFGQNGDIPVSGDFNGDGRTDLAVFRPSNGFWYSAKASGVPAQNFDAYQFGLSTDVPVAADYDGDGKTDIAIYRSGAWWIRRSSDGQIYSVNYGLSSDKSIPASFLQ